MHLGKEVYGENELMEVSLVGLPANPAAVRAWENFGLDLTNTTTGIGCPRKFWSEVEPTW